MIFIVFIIILAVMGISFLISLARRKSGGGDDQDTGDTRR